MVMLAGILLFTALISRAQGTIDVSNLGDSVFGYSVGGGSQSFQTGAASNGYSLNSITLLMGNWLGNASNFVVSIYNDNSGQFGTSLATLNGNSDPETSGEYNYFASNLNLNPSTVYWIVANCESFSSGSFFPPGGYAWQLTASPDYTSSDGWSINTAGNSPPLGNGFLQFAVNATAVPEPSTFALGGLCVGLIFSRNIFRLGKLRRV